MACGSLKPFALQRTVKEFFFFSLLKKITRHVFLMKNMIKINALHSEKEMKEKKIQLMENGKSIKLLF